MRRPTTCLTTREAADVSVIDVWGRISLGEASDVFRDTVHDILANHQKKILINLGEVPYIDSSGIGDLVSVATWVTLSGGQLKLSNLTARVKDLLRISRNDLLFDIHDEEASAIRSFT